MPPGRTWGATAVSATNGIGDVHEHEPSDDGIELPLDGGLAEVTGDE